MLGFRLQSVGGKQNSVVRYMLITDPLEQCDSVTCQMPYFSSPPHCHEMECCDV